MNGDINRKALLGIGIDEATAIVVRQNKFEVIGKKNGVVLIYDPATWTSSTADADKYMTLSPGTKYDLEKRIVLSR